MSQETSTPQETPQAVISNILHANSANIPENDYLRMQNALMQVNNNQNNDSSNETNTGYETTAIVTINEIGLGHFEFNNGLLPEYSLFYQQPLWIAEWIIKQTQKRMQIGFSYADFNFDLAEEFSENNCQRTDYEEITTAVIPILQSRGFDITLYHGNTNYKEDNIWGNYIGVGGMSVWWRAVDPDVFDIGDSYGYMENRKEFFAKTRNSYFYGLPVRVFDEEESESDEEVEEDDEEEEDEESEQSRFGFPRCSIVMTNVVNPENRISFAMSFILERASRFNRIGNCGNFKISQNFYQLTYSEIKNELVPVLQAEGFDVNLCYRGFYDYNEQHFDNMVCVEWKYSIIPTHMRGKILRFHKTADEYHQFEVEEEEDNEN